MNRIKKINRNKIESKRKIKQKSRIFVSLGFFGFITMVCSAGNASESKSLLWTLCLITLGIIMLAVSEIGLRRLYYPKLTAIKQKTPYHRNHLKSNKSVCYEKVKTEETDYNKNQAGFYRKSPCLMKKSVKLT